jgi:hypothetical protein
MPTFDFKSPDGKSYTIEGPEGATPEQAFQILQTQLGGGAPDPVSVNNVGRSFATGVPIVGGLLNKADAATNAGLSYVLNPLFDEKDQLTGSIGERYAHSLRDQEGTDAKFSAEHPIVDTTAKLAGGVASMAPAVAVAPGLFGATGSFAARTGMGVLTNAALGGADAAVRGADPVSGAIVGGVVGGAAPAVEAAASPFVSSIMARFNPTGAAERQVARAVSESGQSPNDITNAVRQAAAEGQGQFNVADALGNPGQRMLSTVARAPGEGRTDVVTALNNRQAGQGGRIVDALEQGFGSRMTPAALKEAMTAARGAQADAEYGAVRNDAGPVNVTPVLDHIDSILGPAQDQQLANVGSALPNDSIEGALQGFRGRISRLNPDDFQSAQRIRGDLADTIDSAVRAGAGNRARLLGGVQRQLDAALEDASQGFRQANANFSRATGDINAIGQGTQAFSRGRTGDILGDFNSLQPRGQQAFRTGFVDPAIQKVTGAADGVNKARPFLNDRFREIADATAPGNETMQRQLAREQTMFETRNQALGGSGTSQNINDDAAMAINPTTVMHVVHGNWGGAIGSLLHAGSNLVTGNTPQVRAAVGRILLQNGATLNPTQLNAMVTKTISDLRFIQQLARSGAGAAAVTTNASQRPIKAPIFVRKN